MHVPTKRGGHLVNVTKIYRAWRVRFWNYIYLVLSTSSQKRTIAIWMWNHLFVLWCILFYLHVETKLLESWMSLNSLTLFLCKICMHSTFEEVCLLCIKRTVIQDNNMNLIEIQIPNVRKAGAAYTHQGAWNFVQLELSIQIICIV